LHHKTHNNMKKKQYYQPTTKLFNIHIRNGLMEGSIQLRLNPVDDVVTNDDGSTQYGKGSTLWDDEENENDLW